MGNWRIQPSEFWGMTMNELFILLSFHNPELTGERIGEFDREQFERLTSMLEKADADTGRA